MSSSIDRHIIEFSSSRFEISLVTDTVVLLTDVPGGLASLSMNIENVLLAIDRLLPGGLKQRKLFFCSVHGHWERIDRDGLEFTGFGPVGEDQARFFQRSLAASGSSVQPPKRLGFYVGHRCLGMSGFGRHLWPRTKRYQRLQTRIG